MDNKTNVEIFFKIDGLETYITDLETLNGVLKQVSNTTEQTKEATEKLDQSTKELSQSTEEYDRLEQRLQTMEGSVKVLAGSLEFLAGAASLLGVEDNEFFKELEQNTLGVVALARGAIDLSEGYSILRRNTQLATIAQTAYNSVANANPYVLLATAVVALAGAVATYVIMTDDATISESEFTQQLIKSNDEIRDKIDWERELARARGEFDMETQITLNEEEITQLGKSIETLKRKAQELRLQKTRQGELNEVDQEALDNYTEKLKASETDIENLTKQNELIRIQIEVEKEREEERKKNERNEEARRNAEQRRLQQRTLELQLTLLQFEEGRDRELEILRRKYEEDIALAKGNAELTRLINQQLADDIKNINDTFRQNELKEIDRFNKERLDKERQLQEQTNELIKEYLINRPSTTTPIPVDDTPDSWAMEWRKAFNSIAEEPEKVFDGLRSDTESAFNFLTTLSEGFTKDEEKRAKRGFQLKKAMALSEATISGIQSVVNTFKSASDSPITTAFPLYPFIAASLAGAFAAAQIAAISRQKYEGGGGGLNTNTNQGINPQALLDQRNTELQGGGGGITTLRQGGDQPVRAYVVLNDINSAQQVNQNILNLSKL